MNNPQPAGFWIRVGATLIDTIVLAIVIAGPLTYIYGYEYWNGEELARGVWDVLLNYVLPIAATIWFWMTYKATPGKLLTGLQVVDAASYDKMSLGQAIGRYFAYIPSGLALCLGFLWVAFDPAKQGWHDKLAKTLVIKEE